MNEKQMDTPKCFKERKNRRITNDWSNLMTFSRKCLSLLLVVFVPLIIYSRSNHNKQEIKRLKAEMVSINEIFSPDFMTLKDNHLFISSSLSKPTMLFAYSVPFIPTEGIWLQAKHR